MPARTYVHLGQKINFTGRYYRDTNPPMALKGRLTLLVGTNMEKTISVDGSWNLEWDTSKQRLGTVRISLRLADAVTPGDTLVRSGEITFVNDLPVVVNTERIGGGVLVKPVFASKFNPNEVVVYVDGQPVPTKHENGSLLLRNRDLNSPRETLSGQIVATSTENGKRYTVSSSVFPLPGHAGLIWANQKAVLTELENPFESKLKFRFGGVAIPNSCKCYVDGREVPADLNGDALFVDPKAFTVGRDKIMWVCESVPDGSKRYTREVPLASMGVFDLKAQLEAKLTTERQRLKTLFKDTIFQGEEFRLSLWGSHWRHWGVGGLPASGGSGLGGGGSSWPKGLTAFRVQVIPEFAEATSEGGLYLASRCERYWQVKPAQKIRDLRDSWKSLRGKTEYGRKLSFVGPYHRRLEENIHNAISAWIDSLSFADEARKQVLSSPTYSNLRAFTDSLNESERFRYDALYKVVLFEHEVGLPAEGIVLIRWVIGPENREDIKRQKKSTFESFNILRDPVSDQMFR